MPPKGFSTTFFLVRMVEVGVVGPFYNVVRELISPGIVEKGVKFFRTAPVRNLGT